jgi:hypothetical protein
MNTLFKLSPLLLLGLLTGCTQPPDMSPGRAYIFSKDTSVSNLATSNATFVIYANFYVANPSEAVAVTVQLPANIGKPGDMLISSNGYWYGIPSKVSLPADVSTKYPGTIIMDEPSIQIISKAQTFQEFQEHKARYTLADANNRRTSGDQIILPDDYGQVGQYARFTADGKLFNVDTNKIELERSK